MKRRGHDRDGGKKLAKYRKGSTPDPEVRILTSLRLGCKPWFGGIPYCLEKKIGVWNPDSTAIQNERNLRTIGGEMQTLYEAGLISTTDPRHMPEKDILTYAASIRHLDPSTQHGKLTLVNTYLNCFRNHALDDLLASGDLRMPRRPPRPIKALSMDDIRDIVDAIGQKPRWPGSISRGLVALYFGASLRPSELRLAEYKHLDLKRMRIWIEHPKGKGYYASPQWVPIIRGDVMPLLRRYLDEREVKFRARKIDPVPLFPKLNGEFYTRERFCSLANEVSELAEVDFTWKDFRPSVTSITLNADRSLEAAMSVQNRHDLKTMRKYYEQIEANRAEDRLRDAWRVNPIQQPQNTLVAKTPLNQSKFEVTGYS